MHGFEGKSAFVTGGAQGIGRAVARAFLDCGASVAVMDADPEALDDVRKALGAGDRVLALAGDVAGEADVDRCLGAAIGRFGRLDALVNNAGVMVRKSPLELTLAEWNRVLAVNLTGMWLCARRAAQALAEARGAMVNIASTRAFQSEPHTEAYSASKGGVVALTHALAMSLGPAVRVNAVAPGWIDVRPWRKPSGRDDSPLSPEDHAQHPCGRVGRPEDVAAMVLHLCSGSAGFVTGACFTVDGGMTRKMIYEE